MRGGMYWSGDLAYRDADGWIYFAGRTGDWLRVDGENLATAPIERILLRHPAVSEAAVYALPDRVGDKVACALVLRGPLTADELWSFLRAQPDLSPKAWPSVVRILDALAAHRDQQGAEARAARPPGRTRHNLVADWRGTNPPSATGRPGTQGSRRAPGSSDGRPRRRGVL